VLNISSSHPETPDQGAGSAAGPDARNCDAVIAALFQGAATQQTGLPRPNPPTRGVLGWELSTLQPLHISSHCGKQSETLLLDSFQLSTIKTGSTEPTAKGVL